MRKRSRLLELIPEAARTPEMLEIIDRHRDLHRSVIAGLALVEKCLTEEPRTFRMLVAERAALRALAVAIRALE